MLPLSPPKASAKPTAQYAIAAIERLAITLAATVPAFFIREKPTSSSRKPACMSITSAPAMYTHRVSMRALSSLSRGFVNSFSSSLLISERRSRCGRSTG